MENKLDKLFRDKLEQHSIQPPALAWKKVASGFPKKNKTIVWAWRIAAAITLVGAMGWYLINGTSEQVQAQKETPVTKIQDEIKSNAHVEKNLTMKKEEQVPPAIQVKPKTRTRTQQSVEKIEMTQVEVKEQAVTKEAFQVEEPIASVEEVIEPKIINESTMQSKKEKAMVIVFNLAPVEAKREVEPAKVNGFKKVIDFAKDVKGGETTLASIRDWKDNFFGSDEQTRVEKQTNNH